MVEWKRNPKGSWYAHPHPGWVLEAWAAPGYRAARWEVYSVSDYDGNPRMEGRGPFDVEWAKEEAAHAWDRIQLLILQSP